MKNQIVPIEPSEKLVEFLRETCANPDAFGYQLEDFDLLIKIVQFIRPSKPRQISMVNLTPFVEFLEQNTNCATMLSEYLKAILHQRKFNKFISDVAILRDAVFLIEVRKRLFAKILPNQPQKFQLEFVLNQVFYHATDAIWVKKIPYDQLESIFDLLKFDTIYETSDKNTPLSEVMVSMGLIIQRISGRAMETEVIKMVPEFDDLESPFTAFEIEFKHIEERIRSEELHFLQPEDLAYKQLQVLWTQCNDFADKAFANSSKYGISIRVNQNLLKIRQQLERLQVLMPILVVGEERDKKEHTISLSLLLITYNCYKNNVRKFIGESTQLLSYEITQHTARTGEGYITESRAEYFRMFRAAIGGGLIVGILCIIKLLLSRVETSYFGHAFIYSMNYSFGFIAIYILGFTLATKQPAMTASALMKSLDEGIKKQAKDAEKYQAFAVLFARVFRSQFIAFVGNVMMAFPVALFGAWAIDQIFHDNIAMARYPILLNNLSPIHSPAIFHAAIAGVFLFLSGIISGSVSNRNKHSQVYYRIEEHPLLKKRLGKVRTKKFAEVYERRWAGIVSNFWFGIFMGSTASLGMFLGLDIDVRHITFASGNLALALYGSGFHISNTMLFWGIFGIGIIGLINFTVSFGLSLGLAFRSRNISFFEVRYIIVAIWEHFKRKPFSFFVPTETRSPIVVEENQNVNLGSSESHS